MISKHPTTTTSTTILLFFFVIKPEFRGSKGQNQYKGRYSPMEEIPVLTARQAQDLIGIGAGQLLLLALTDQIPSEKDPDTRLILFESSALQGWFQTYGSNLLPHSTTSF